MLLRENEIGGKVAPFLEPGGSLLDLGSGTGLIARWLAERAGVRPTLADLVTYDNRVPDLPFLEMSDPVRIPAADDAYDVVMMLFVLHHMERWEEQESLVREAARVARRRLVIIEDTPASRLDRVFNVAWDWLLNLRHGVPKPFTFRTVEGWRPVFERAGLTPVHLDTYRARWPTLMTYHHTLFVLEPPSVASPSARSATATMPGWPSRGPTTPGSSPPPTGPRSAAPTQRPPSSTPPAT